MNVASLELCKELFELSGWDETDNWYHEAQKSGDEALCLVCLRDMAWHEHVPAYDLGYLLRKLQLDKPYNLEMNAENEIGIYWFHMQTDLGSRGETGKRADTTYWNSSVEAEADTPEDAAAKLAIELLKSGVITRDGASV